ncbi:MAG: glycosyltransferase [Desulfuromonadales bacterium]|nr:glycosyltransferase [Desulfuromonadales bacterium]NIR33850.1 glycosyltransferase [Desulfuromonadales bacterium]NIS42530.1 glycosyltransferase [Desulfuromonadales bacterium]
MQKQAVGIFAKEPVAGRVKTRMCPPLSPSQAAALYETSLRETVASMAAGHFDLVLFCAGEAEWFRGAFPDLPLVAQQGTDLGERMTAALAHLQASYEKTALIGSDSPDLPPVLVEEALAALDGEGVVVIPASDGGYALVGERGHHPEMFRDIPWSTAEVLPASRRRAAECSIALKEVGKWEDLDDLHSLQRLVQRSPASRTAAFAREHLADLLSIL